MCVLGSSYSWKMVPPATSLVIFICPQNSRYDSCGDNSKQRRSVSSRLGLSTNAFLKTTVRNNVSVLEFIVHYLLHVLAPIGGHLQVKCTQNIY
jgi:hypothetical protein